MLANWIKQPTATTGAGTITLGTKATNFVGIADQYNAGSQVHYFIEDDNGNREEGIGLFTTGPEELTRPTDQIIATLTAGTLAKYPGVALTLSGSATVTVSASADNIAGSGIAYLTPSTGIYDIPDNFATASDEGLNATADTQIFIPCVLLYRRIINNLAINVRVGDAASIDTRLGLWEQAIDGGPGLLLFDTGHIDVTTATVKSVAPGSPIPLNPGVYWLGFRSDSTILKTRIFKSSGLTTTSQFGPGGVWSSNNDRRSFPGLASQTGALTSNMVPTSNVFQAGAVGFNLK